MAVGRALVIALGAPRTKKRPFCGAGFGPAAGVAPVAACVAACREIPDRPEIPNVSRNAADDQHP
jgi:hypothetical protein